MLNFFLVLGLVPGTNFQLTFGEIIFLGLALALFTWRFFARHGHVADATQPVIQLSRLHSFSYPIASQPVQAVPIHRKVAALLIDTFVQHLGQAVRRFRQYA